MRRGSKHSQATKAKTSAAVRAWLATEAGQQHLLVSRQAYALREQLKNLLAAGARSDKAQ